MGSEVEPELAFFQEQREVVLGNTIVFAQHPFGLVPEILNAVDVPSRLDEALGVLTVDVVQSYADKRSIKSISFDLGNGGILSR